MMLKTFLTTLLILSFNIVSHAKTLKVGLVLDKGGKDDKSFNSAAYLGATKAEKDLKIELKYVEATDTNAVENLLRSFARKNFDLVIGIGFGQKEPVKKVAPQFPQVKFAVVDSEVSLPNVRSLLFEEHEGSFLVGALAAMASKNNSVGYVGGMDIPLIRRFAMGYAAGAKYVNPKIKVTENYIGVTGEAWNNPAKAKELALSQFAAGTDVIFVAAGASNTGVFDAAEEKKKWAIGVDSNQNWIKPGVILTSMMKAVDVAVYDTIKETSEGKFAPGIIRYGLKNKGVDYTLDQYNEKLITPEMKNKVEEIKKKIIAGQITVPDFYKKK
ncbi:BMP family ABC transporter substrate-binding protein [Bdellovibrio sp. ArHS]|uniref:BMP family lipoprotein n=1 Tax=Bdellovibrio sp. ArHS TaxID=1569284 RepID=UPI0025C3DDC5|nr:BMP family ABC transporter substrate-binding protein [Bdellovibrio sp. ArHS]